MIERDRGPNETVPTRSISGRAWAAALRGIASAPVNAPPRREMKSRRRMSECTPKTINLLARLSC
jgi:hypothetical protein